MFEQLYDMSEKFSKGTDIDTLCMDSKMCERD